MITKAVLYSDYIADLTVHLLKDQQIRIPVESTQLFRSTLKLPEQCALSKVTQVPMPFKQQILNHEGDIFLIQTNEQKEYEGTACVEDQNVYVLDSNQQTVVVPLSQVQSIRNVTLSKSE